MECAHVAVVGGGPAGTAAALTLVKAGLSVVLVERSRYGGERMGETLPPAARPLLAGLGVWNAFMEHRPVAVPATIAVWGSGTPYSNDTIFNPYGCGWHIDRLRFDAMLAEEAQARGARLWRNMRVTECARAQDGSWHLTACSTDESVGEVRRLQTAFLVEAVGRASLSGGLSAQPRNQYDRLVGLVQFYSDPAREEVRDGCTWIESCERGWWYSVALPGSKAVTTFLTDADLLDGGGRPGWLTTWNRALAQAAHTQSRISAWKSNGPPCLVSASTTFRPHSASKHQVLAGDAVSARDPLSGQGLCHALQGGVEAAQAVCAALAGDADALKEYAARQKVGFATYLSERAYFYGCEQRWSNAPFWQRRQVTPSAYEAA